jgi:hypothetical protein
LGSPSTLPCIGMRLPRSRRFRNGRSLAAIFCFVSGHDFSRAAHGQNGRGFSPCHRKIRTKFLWQKPQGLKSLSENSVLSPVGTSESSPGRSPGLGMRHRTVPKGRLKIRTRCSAVPRGTVELAYHYPGLRPGLFSDVPTGLSAEGSHADSKAPLFSYGLYGTTKVVP